MSESKKEFLWENDNYCYACGKKNPAGLQLDFKLEGETLSTEVIFKKEHQGYKDTVHGGFITLVLDEVMVNLPYRLTGKPVVSAEIEVRLKKPAKVGEKIIFTAKIAKKTGKIFYLEAKAALTDDTVIALANSKCVGIWLEKGN